MIQKREKDRNKKMKEFKKSSPNLAVIAMASIFLVSAIFVANAYHKATTWFIIPTRSEISTSQDYSSTTSITDQDVSNGTNSEHRDEKLERLEAGLASARALIREAMAKSKNRTMDLDDADYIPHGEIYRNAYAFHWSYLLMERLFKIFVYEEGEPPIFHNGPCKSIYSMEGMFLSLMETENSRRFKTRDPDQAHVYFLPFSVVMIVKYLFDPVVRDKAVLQRTVVDYVRTVSSKYPYWNRSLGADHFMLSCHDWGPRATWYVPELYHNSIRVLCNANTSERFNPRKDASFPEINLKTGKISPLPVPVVPRPNRDILAFFAGRLHGKIRAILFRHWKDKDADLRVHEALPKGGPSYEAMLARSRFCLCPSGYEVASPRIAEAVLAGCVPVLVSQRYVAPFSDVLDWGAFSVGVPVSDIPRLKEILAGVSEDRYVRLRENVNAVKRHFVVNDPPERYDVFHMIVHSVWLRRLNVKIN